MSTAGGISVLHVDDEPGFVDMVATYLEREHDRISAYKATSPSDGLEKLAEHDVDCIVSDYDMPGTDGIEFLNAVRERYSDLPFILYTGKGSEEIASDAISAGVTDYLQKESGTSQYTVLANRIDNAVDQYRSRQAVQETERKLSELAERTDDILFIFNGDWSELLFINSAYEDLWGGSIEELEEDPASFLELIHPDDRDDARASMEQVLKGESAQLEYRVVRPDGEHRWVRGDTQPIKDEDGNIVRIVGQVRDSTELKQRELHLETIIDNLPGYVYRHEYDSEYPLKFVKGDAQTVTGYTAAELEEEIVRAEEIIHPDDREDLWASLLTELEDTGRFDSTYRIISKDGDVRWIRDQGQLVDDPVTGEAMIDGFITDISNQIQGERELRERNRQLQAVLDSVEASIWIRDAENRFELVNQNFRNLFGFADDTEIVGKRPSELFPEEIATQFRANDQPVIETGGSVEVQEEVTTDQGTRTFLTRITPLYGDGEVVGTCGVASDITAQKERERALERQNERLDQFASTLRHELRNPLNILDGYLDVARETGNSDAFESCQTAVDQMQRLLEQTLVVLKGGNTALDREPVELGAVCEACWEGIPAPEARLKSDTTREFVADEDRLKQLLGNLFRNAVEHGASTVTIRVGDLETGFYVEDDGPGIPEDIREAVFEEGYSTNVAGSGLGLAVVEAIAAAHDWEVRITDSPMGGARFEISGVETP